MKNYAIRKVSQRTSKRTNKEKIAISPSQNVLFLASNYKSVTLEKPPFKYKYIYEEVLPLVIAELSFEAQNIDSNKLS